MTDREIVEWVANAKVGDALPPSLSVLLIGEALERAGWDVPWGAPLDGPAASVWAREWLEQHPLSE